MANDFPVALVTGAGTGIGRAVSLAVLAADYRLVLVGRRLEPLQETVALAGVTELAHAISHRLAGFQEREGILERDEENSNLNWEEGDEDPLQPVLGCPLSYRIAIGPQEGRRVFPPKTVPCLTIG